MEPWKADRILALAPDPASAKAGQGLSNTSKWVSLGQNEEALWGECQGSGANPYQTQIDLSEPAFKCSCPSRKFPCKHGLGLFLLLGPKIPIVSGSPPEWVTKWLASRQEKAQGKKEKAEKPAEIADPAAQAKRATDRMNKVVAGIEGLRTWLFDLIRNGLASIPQDPRFFEQPAARLVDAQAPGAARMVRELESLAHSGPHWQTRLLEKISYMHLMIEAFQKIDSLPSDTQADIRSLVGFTIKEEEILQGTAVRDKWQVLGQKTEEEDRLRVQRSWLRGVNTRKFALILSFSPIGQAMKTTLVAGTSFEADLVFHPSGYSLRALVKERYGETVSVGPFRGHSSLKESLIDFGEAITRQPWLQTFPICLKEVTLQRFQEKWYFRDAHGNALPLAPRYPRAWELNAISGGLPMDGFFEFDGKALAPLGFSCGGTFYDLE